MSDLDTVLNFLDDFDFNRYLPDDLLDNLDRNFSDNLYFLYDLLLELELDWDLFYHQVRSLFFFFINGFFPMSHIHLYWHL